MSMADYDLYDRAEPNLTGVERDLYDAVSADVPWALVEQFADLERVSGSEDEERAAEYVTDRLDEFGIDYDRHDPSLYLSIPESASLRAESDDFDGGTESFDAVKTVAFGGGEASGEVVPVGSGPGEASGVDDLLSADLGDLSGIEGKIALLGGILPIEAVEELEAAGAAGVIVQHPHQREPHEGIATPVWGGAPTPRSDVDAPDIPIVTVADPVGESLRDAEEPTADLSAETTTGWFDCRLVHARISAGGSADGGDSAGVAHPDAENDFVLLHGHYDSWHVGVADNATGDAALLELARVFEDHSDELDRDLWVCWWPGHSTGRYAGSTWFADEYALDIRERCVTQVNVDSPGSVDATEFEDMVVWMPEADDLCRAAIADTCGKEATENRPPRAGDYSFDNLGVTGAFMLSSNIPTAVREERGYHAVGGCGGHSDAWHLTTDTLDKADPEVLVRDVRVYVVALARLLRDEVLPLDHRETVARHREYLAGYDDAAGEAFDLGPAREALDELAGAVDDLYAAVDDGSVDPGDANAAIRGLSRRLVRLSFCEAGRFEQDPATPRPPYPRLAWADDVAGMDDPERGFARTALRRGRNHVVEELAAACDAVEEVLE
ncbi:MAG: M28 family peptidase [Halobaculum sp.]